MGKCTKPENHSNHVCQLKIQQKFDEVKKVRIDAEFYCSNCDSQAKSSDNLCSPLKFEGKAGILKWKK